MRHRPTRFRRLGVSAAAVTLCLTGLSVLALEGAAFAASGLASGSSITASSAPGISSTGTNQPVGNLNINFAAGTQWATGDVINITLKDSAGASKVFWDHAPTLSTTPPAGDANLCNAITNCTVLPNPIPASTSTITIMLTGVGQNAGSAPPAPGGIPVGETLTLSNIGYTTNGAANGLVAISDVLGGTIATPTPPSVVPPTFTTGNSAANAIIGKPTVSVLADSTPSIGTPSTAAAGGPVEIELSGANTAWATGDVIYITVARNDDTNCETAGFPDTVGFASVPNAVVEVAQNGTTTAAPTVSLSLASMGSCSSFSGVNNVLKVTFTNSGALGTDVPGTSAYGDGAAVDIFLAGTSASAGPSLNVSADHYAGRNGILGASGSTTNLGPIAVQYGLNTPPTFQTTGATTINGGTTSYTSVANDLLAATGPGSSLGIPGTTGLNGGTVLTALSPAAVCNPTTAANFTVAALPSALAAGSIVRVGVPPAPGSATASLNDVTLTAAAAAAATTITGTCSVPVTAGTYPPNTPVGGPSFASITFSQVTVTANKPATTLQYNFANCTTAACGESVNNPISPITITEANTGALGGGVNGYFCLTLTQATLGIVEWNSSSTPTATASGGGLAVSPTLTLFTPGGQSGPTVLEGQVTTASSTGPGSVTISGLSINVPEVALTITASLTYQANNPSCTLGAPLASSSNPFIIANVAGRTFGQADSDTAAQEFENMGCSTGEDSIANGHPVTPEVAAVAATDIDFNDAEAGSYLAGSLPGPGAPLGTNTTAGSLPHNVRGTGILVTPQGSLAPGFLAALRITGTTDVYVLGGVDAFSQANVTQLESTPVYNCDGTVHLNPTNGTTMYLTVHVLAGLDADGTAQLAGDLFGPAGVGVAKYPGAYGTTMYNDTTGSSGSPASTAPDTAVATCLVANDSEFQDAASGGAMAANQRFPLFETGPTALSVEAQTGLTNDACRQVINLGGPAAESDNILSQEEALGLSVLRIGGIDYTDTSQLTAQFEFNSVNLSQQAVGLDWDPTYVIAVRGDFYTDAFTAAGISNFNRNPGTGAGFIPILLTWDSNNTHSPSGTNYLGNFLQMIGQTGYDPFSDGSATINNMWIIGGTFAVTQSLENTLVNDLNTKGTPS